jgi:hypothetical protein
LLAEGLTIKQIAGLLNLSEKTVEFHQHHVMAAFNLRSNAAMVNICLEARIDFAKALTVLREYRHSSGYEFRFHGHSAKSVVRKCLGYPTAVFTGCGPALEAERFVHHCISAQRKTLTRRKSLDRYRTLGSRKEIPPHQRLPKNSVAGGTPESRTHSAEGGPHRRSRLNLIRGRLTVPSIESRCDQLKPGHPRAGSRNR